MILQMKILNLDLQNILKLEMIDIWAQRLSYVGELGYEFYVKNSDAKKLYNTYILEGKKFRFISLWNACDGHNENGKWFCTLGP